MSVLVTGASGLVGSHVVTALTARGEAVRALVLPASRDAVQRLGAEAVVGDVTDPAAWQAAARGVRAIVHAAAIVQRRASWEQYVAVNVDATRHAVAAARAAGARLIHISYPFQPIAETDFYARSKRLAESVVREAGMGREVEAVALRPTVIYGERDRMFTPRVIRAARLRILPRIGPGTNRLSVVYAGNVAAAVVAALDARAREGFRAYNVTGDGPPALTQQEFLGAFAAALGWRSWSFPIPARLAGVAMRLFTNRRLARAGVGFISGDNPYIDDRIYAELSWRPPTPAPEAIRRTVAWFLKDERPETWSRASSQRRAGRA
ncbi:MAG: hypothetical protein DMD34_03925 [Gemmatimonadetes bacterium]|nr:MAG: hypothetical protein DMD34_03925 [Gemmatimonadota bacterium]